MKLDERLAALVRAIGLDIKSLSNSVAKPVFTIEIDLGYPAKQSGSFLITGLSSVTINKQVVVSQASAPYTGKGINSDEFEMDTLVCSGYVVDATTIKVHYSSRYSVGGNFKFNYFIQ